MEIWRVGRNIRWKASRRSRHSIHPWLRESFASLGVRNGILFCHYTLRVRAVPTQNAGTNCGIGEDASGVFVLGVKIVENAQLGSIIISPMCSAPRVILKSKDLGIVGYRHPSLT